MPKDRIVKVADSNYLRSPKLRDYLQERKNNFVVMTDYAAMEAYKKDPLITLPRSMEILSDYPKQVIILKGTNKICCLSGRQSGLSRRMVDTEQTREFPAWCGRLKEAAQSLDPKFDRHLTLLGREAEAQMNKVLADASSMPKTIKALVAEYGREDVSRLRRKEFTEELLRRLISNIIETAGHLYRNHPRTQVLRSVSEAPNLFIFRSAMMIHLLALKWIYLGGIESAPAEKLRNDIIDMNFAAYATYFDGLLTNDEKLDDILTEGKALLSVISRGISLSAPARP